MLSAAPASPCSPCTGWPWEDLQPGLADALAAGLADPVGAGRDAVERALGLQQHVPGVVGDRHLVLALEVLRAGVGLVVAGAGAGVAQQVAERLVGGGDVGAQPVHLGAQVGLDLGDLLGGPGSSPTRTGSASAPVLGFVVRAGARGAGGGRLGRRARGVLRRGRLLHGLRRGRRRRRGCGGSTRGGAQGASSLSDRIKMTGHHQRARGGPAGLRAGSAYGRAVHPFRITGYAADWCPPGSSTNHGTAKIFSVRPLGRPDYATLGDRPGSDGKLRDSAAQGLETLGEIGRGVGQQYDFVSARGSDQQ